MIGFHFDSDFSSSGYSLTPRAETLIPIMDHLIEWALDNMAVILKDRDKAVG